MHRKSTLFMTKSRSDDILQFATTVASLGKELATISSFPPAVAAVSTVLLILETVQVSISRIRSLPTRENLRIRQEVKTNQEACLRLAQRAAKILIDVNDQMDGRWEAAPEILLKNLEKYRDTLAAIHRYMTLQADVKWRKRFATKGSVAESLSDLDELLTDATQGFQIATLISIHHAVTSPHAESSNHENPDNPTPQTCSLEEIDPSTTEADNTQLRQHTPTPINPDDFVCLQERPDYPFHQYISSEKASGHHFQKYKYSAIHPCTSTGKLDGWWSFTTEAEVDGQKMFLKTYDQEPENAIKDWLQDVKLLQNLFHPNLPQMIGSSPRNAPVPFVLLFDVLTSTPQEVILKNLRSTTVEACVQTVLRFHSEIQDAALFLKQSLHLENSQIQAYLDDVSIGTDSLDSIILGLPTYSKGHYLTYRNHGIIESLKHICMGLLPQVTDEINQSDKLQIKELFSEMNRHFFARFSPIQRHAFLDDDDDDDINIKPIFDERLISGQGWRRYDPCTSHHFAVGDFGYVPKGAGINAFVKLGNIFTDELATMSMTENAFGVQWDGKSRQPSTLSDSSFIGGLACWSLAINNNNRMTGQIVHRAAVPHEEAYRFLLQSGEAMANELNLGGQPFRLVTSVETKQDFDICNYTYPTMPSVTTTMYFHTALGMMASPYLSRAPTRVIKGGIPLALEPGWICATKVRAGIIETISLASKPD